MREDVVDMFGRSRYFLEEDAVDSQGRLTREKQKAVNKIGHGKSLCLFVRSADTRSMRQALHVLDPVFRKVTLENERLRTLVRDLKFHRDPVGRCSNHGTLNEA